jgi:hypothetical protein
VLRLLLRMSRRKVVGPNNRNAVLTRLFKKKYAYCLIFGIMCRVFKIYAQEDVIPYIMGKSKVVLLHN